MSLSDSLECLSQTPGLPPNLSKPLPLQLSAGHLAGTENHCVQVEALTTPSPALPQSSHLSSASSCQAVGAKNVEVIRDFFFYTLHSTHRQMLALP